MIGHFYSSKIQVVSIEHRLGCYSNRLGIIANTVNNTSTFLIISIFIAQMFFQTYRNKASRVQVSQGVNGFKTC